MSQQLVFRVRRGGVASIAVLFVILLFFGLSPVWALPSGKFVQQKENIGKTAVSPNRDEILAKERGAVVISDTPTVLAADELPIPLQSPVQGAFIPNVGQFAADTFFETDAFSGGTLAFKSGEVHIALPVPNTQEPVLSETEPAHRSTSLLTQTVTLQFINANPAAAAVGVAQLPGVANYFIGNDPEMWRTNVATYAGLAYRELYPDVNLYYTHEAGGLKGTYVVAPGGDPGLIRWTYTGATDVIIDRGTGDLSINLPAATPTMPQLVEQAPTAWQEINGQHVPVAAAYTLDKDGQIGFALGTYDAAYPLIIDPNLIYKITLNGLTAFRTGFGITANSMGEAFVVGSHLTSSYNDIVVTKLDANGGILYTTYLGGTRTDNGYDIAVDGSGSVVATGETESTNFPIAGTPFQSTYGGGSWDGFVLRLDASGVLVYSSYLGGNSYDYGYGIGLDGANNIYIAGTTSSNADTFPVTSGAYDTVCGATGCSSFLYDAFVLKLNAGGALLYGTYLGGSLNDSAHDLAVDSAGYAYILGSTTGAFPTYNAAQSSFGGGRDAFVTKLSPAGNSLLYSTYLGGSGTELGAGCWQGYYIGNDLCGSIAVDSNGYAYVTGDTQSANFPTQNALDTMLGGSYDAFVARYTPSGAVSYATYLGGSANDGGTGIAVDSSGNAYVSGYTYSSDFPTVDEWQSHSGGNSDGFLTRINTAGDEILYSTYFGGAYGDTIFDIATDNADNIYTTGKWSLGFWSGYAFVSRFGNSSGPVLFPGQDWNVECPFCGAADTQGIVQGVNTRSGNFGYLNTALSLPVAGGSLDFRYGYISQAIDVYTTTMGYGWEHNFDMQLHISDPAPTHTIILQAPGGSRFPYFGNGDGTYERYPGVTADLVHSGSNYIVTTFNQYQFTFNSSGQLVQQEDPFGNIVTFSYATACGEQRLYRATQGSRYLQYSYNCTTGYLSGVSDSSGRQVTLGYTNGDLTSVSKTGTEETTQYQYHDAAHLLTDIIDGSGRTVKEIVYDGNGRATRILDGNGDVLVAVNYGSSTAAPQQMTVTSLSATSVVTASGVVMTHTYDARGTLTGVMFACSDGTVGCGTGRGTGFDSNFKQDDMLDANGHATSLSWNAGGSNLESITDALGHHTRIGYDSYNNLTQTVDARGLTTTYGYHNASLPTFRTHMTDTLEHVTIYTPTLAGVDGPVSGLLHAQQDPNGRLTFYAYNAYGQITQTVQAAGTAAAITITYGYDDAGQLITSTQASATESHTTLSAYDDGSHLLATITNWTGSNPTNWADDCDTSSGPRDTNVCTRYGYDAAGRVISTTNTLNQTDLTFYDDAGHAYLRVRNYDGTSYTNPQADLCDFADPVSNLCSLTEYDAYGRIITTTDSLGRMNVTEYDSLGRVSRTVTNWEDGVFSAVAPDRDIETRTQYDAVGNTLIVTDTVGHMTRSFYDELNRVAGTIVNWDGSTTLANCATLPTERDSNICTQYAYDEVGNTIIVTDTLGHMTRTFYDEMNRTMATVTNWNPATLTAPADCILAADNANTENLCTVYGYDAVGNQITTTNTLAQTSLTVYDAADRPVVQVANWDGTTTILPDGTGCATATDALVNICTHTEYDALGRRASTTDPLGHVTTYAYDGLDRIITTTHSLNQLPVTTLQSYDGLGNRLAATDANGHTVTYIYDSLNRLVTTVSPAGTAITQTYNAAGWVLTTTNSLGHEMVTTYDELGQRTGMTDPEGNTTTYVYDALGNQVAVMDAEGITTTYHYDGLNRLVTVIENDVPGSNPTAETDVVTQYSYDALGNRTVITNARGFTHTVTTYDSLNRPILVTDALGNQTQTEYNALGYQTVITDGNGAVTQYSYDARNRLTATAYLADNETVQVAYDALGNRTVMTDSLGVNTYSYDDLSRLITVTNSLTGTVGYQYDNVGNRTQMIYPDGRQVLYQYNADNRMILADNWGPGITTYAYDIAGRLITTTLPNGITSVNAYDAANRLTQLSHHDGTGILLAQFDYQLDNLGNRAVATETLRVPLTSNMIPATQPDVDTFSNIPALTTTSLQSIVIQYQYDPMQRLTNADYSGALSASYQYVYDTVGNMTAYTETVGGNSTIVQRSFNAANQMLTATDTEAGTTSYYYDNNGSLVQILPPGTSGEDWPGVLHYGYDQRNLLITNTVYISGTGWANQVRYRYDGDGNRVQQIDFSSGQPITTTYTNDNNSLSQVLVSGSGTTTYNFIGLNLVG